MSRHLNVTGFATMTSKKKKISFCFSPSLAVCESHGHEHSHVYTFHGALISALNPCCVVSFDNTVLQVKGVMLASESA